MASPVDEPPPTQTTTPAPDAGRSGSLGELDRDVLDDVAPACRDPLAERFGQLVGGHLRRAVTDEEHAAPSRSTSVGQLPPPPGTEQDALRELLVGEGARHGAAIASAALQRAERGELVRRHRVGDPDIGRRMQRPPGRLPALLDRHAGMDVRQHQLARRRVGPQQAEVGDDQLWSCAAQAEPLPVPRPVTETERRAEVDAFDERPRRLAHDHHHLARRGRDLRRPACTRQPCPGVVVVADHRRVDVGEAVELGAAEEADVDPPGLQPVGEDLRHADDGVGRVAELAVADRQRQVVSAWIRCTPTRRRAPAAGRTAAGRGWRPSTAGRCRRSRPRRPAPPARRAPGRR